MTLTPGQLVQNRYRVDALLGQGGFGAVYHAWDLRLNVAVAIKENLDTSPDAQRQFQREAALLAHLNHPNLPHVTDHFFMPAMGQYLVMDFVEGEDLQAMLDRIGHPLPEAQVLAWIDQVCAAVAYLHSQNPPVIHRDIKPANIRITPEGKAMLVDFGISKVYDPALKTTIGARAVTPPYSPPEQYGADATDARSDVYALGVTLYVLLTNREPPESVSRVANNLALTPPRQIEQRVSPQVDAAIVRACAISKTNRFQTAAELRQALTTHGPITPSIPAATVPVTARSSALAKRLAIAGGALIGLLLLALIIGGVASSANKVDVAVTQAAMAVAAAPTTAPVPVATATPWVTSTAALASTPRPTFTPLPPPTVTPSCPAVTGGFANTGNVVQSAIGCATGRAFSGQIVQENFAGGKMFWREPIDSGQALVLFNDGTWQIFKHTPYPGSPEFWCPAPDTPEQCPPVPRRGFGMMWCDIAAIREGLGNATDCEYAYDGTMQQFERGFMLRTDRGAIYVFHADGQWERK